MHVNMTSWCLSLIADMRTRGTHELLRLPGKWAEAASAPVDAPAPVAWRLVVEVAPLALWAQVRHQHVLRGGRQRRHCRQHNMATVAAGGFFFSGVRVCSTCVPSTGSDCGCCTQVPARCRPEQAGRLSSLGQGACLQTGTAYVCRMQVSGCGRPGRSF